MIYEIFKPSHFAAGDEGPGAGRRNLIMAPSTSTTLLRDIASSAEHARWSEFVSRYRPMMLAFMNEHFPFVSAEDAIQETLVALVKAIPNYRYDPESTGLFRSYLTGILSHKAVDLCRKNSRHEALKEEWRKRCEEAQEVAPAREDVRKTILEIAMRQLMLDEFGRQQDEIEDHDRALRDRASCAVAWREAFHTGAPSARPEHRQLGPPGKKALHFLFGP